MHDRPYNLIELFSGFKLIGPCLIILDFVFGGLFNRASMRLLNSNKLKGFDKYPSLPHLRPATISCILLREVIIKAGVSIDKARKFLIISTPVFPGNNQSTINKSYKLFLAFLYPDIPSWHIVM